MIKFNINLIGFEELNKQASNIQRLKPSTDETVKQVGMYGYNLMKLKAPVYSGALVNSIQLKYEKDTAVISSTQPSKTAFPYPYYIEMGTYDTIMSNAFLSGKMNWLKRPIQLRDKNKIGYVKKTANELKDLFEQKLKLQIDYIIK